MLRLLMALVLSVLALAAPEASATNYILCNGQRVLFRNPVIMRNSCLIPSTSTTQPGRYSAYLNGANQWNNLIGTATLQVGPASDCSVTTGDMTSEVGTIPFSLIAPQLGLTFRVFNPPAGTCVPTPVVVASDIVVPAEMDVLTWTNPAANEARPRDGRAVFVHEFGHLFALQHQDDPVFSPGDATVSVLRRFVPLPRVGGPETATIFPQDALGMATLYGFRSSLVNLMPHHFLTPGQLGASSIEPIITDLAVCRGRLRSVQFGITNYGNVASPPYTARIRLSRIAPSPNGTGGYYQAPNGTNTFTATTYSMPSLGAFTSLIQTFNYSVPAALPNGLYYVYFDMDPLNTVPEFRDMDNRTLGGRSIQVSC